jgi:GDPmannose 4,6-dehydratase
VTRKITAAVAAIAAGRQDALSLGTLDVRRDWGWAPDYVRAAVAAVRAEQADDWVVATGVAHSIEDFVARAFARVGIEDWEPLVRLDPAFVRPADVAEQIGDASKARRELGWEPSLEFGEIVDAMVDHDVALLAGEPDGMR